MPEAALSSIVKTPEEEFDVHRRFIDKALASGTSHVSLIWHPWSLHLSDPEMRMLELVFRHVRAAGLPASTFANFVRTECLPS